MTGAIGAPIGAPNVMDPVTRPLDGPVVTADGHLVHRAVPYAVRPGFRPLLLDLHRPQGTGPAVPLILFLHGGGWRLGDRTVFCPTWNDWPTPPFAQLVEAGFAVASVDYRLSGEAIYPAQLDDVTAALGWLDARAGELGIDTARVVAWGESAGAHLAAMLALTSTGPDAAPAGRIVGVVDWYGPADLLSGPAADDPGSREAALIGAAPAAAPDRARAASPVSAVHPGAPPFHIAHGTDDRFVPAAQSRQLADELAGAGVAVTLDLVAGADHLWMGAPDPEGILARATDFARGVTGTDDHAPGGGTEHSP